MWIFHVSAYMHNQTRWFSLYPSQDYSLRSLPRFSWRKGRKDFGRVEFGNRFLPPNLTTFLWKISHHAIPVDNQALSKGIQVVSLCKYCREHQEETVSHLFLKPKTAMAVWKCFGQIFDYHTTSIRLFMLCLGFRTLQNSPNLSCVELVQWLGFFRKYGYPIALLCLLRTEQQNISGTPFIIEQTRLIK